MSGVFQGGVDDLLARTLRPGQRIVVGQGFGSPLSLIDALPRHLDRLAGSHLFVGWVLGDFPVLPGVEITTFFPSGPFGTAEGMTARGARYLRRSLYEVTSDFRNGELAADVVLAQATPPRQGRYSLGVSVDFVARAAEHAPSVLLELSPHTPWTGHSSTIRDRAGVLAVEAGSGPALLQRGSGRDAAMATHLLDWIPDGATLELGIGQWLEPVVERLASLRRGLRIHSGSVGDWLLALRSAGALDDGQPIAAAAAGGTKAFYEQLPNIPHLSLSPADVTHAPHTLRNLPKFRAVNSVLEVDLFGRANCEVSAGGRRGGIAGLPDFAGGAAANPDGLSIIALASTAKEHSRIVPSVGPQPPSLSPELIDVVVTEHGSADLQGATAADRAAALIRVAAPEHRDSLWRAAETLGLR